MKSLSTRVLSALAVLLILGGAYYLFSSTGILVLATFACLVGCYEFSILTLRPFSPHKFILPLFLFICVGLFAILLFAQDGSTWALLLMIIYFIICSLWSLNSKFDNQKLLNFISLATLGFLYCVFLPAFALKLLILPNGPQWFLFLLGVVFAGDVFAYFGGILFGKSKLMPTISPNKTLAGSLFAVGGSLLVGLLIYRFVIHGEAYLNIGATILIASILAQSGDLFESLIKRAANVKDSGHFMPGHGGVLDRFDGIYFAAPLIYSLALTLNT